MRKMKEKRILNIIEGFLKKINVTNNSKSIMTINLIFFEKLNKFIK